MPRSLSQRGANFRMTASGDVVTLVAGGLTKINLEIIASSQADREAIVETTLSIAINTLIGVELESMLVTLGIDKSGL